jgi:hypothetical protein
MTSRNKLACCIALAIAGGTQVAFAEDANQIFSVSGYGTLGLVHSTEDKADFIPLVGPPKGVGHSDSTTPETDSRVGLQVNAKFNEKFSAVAQFVSELDENNSYDPQLVAANVKYKITPNLDIAVGRFMAPLYVLTDFERIGYAFPWVRPPVEVYNVSFSADGAIGTYRFTSGSAAFTTQLFYSHSSNKTFTTDGMLGLSVQADIGAHSFRVARVHSSLTINSAALNSALDYYRPALPALANQWAVNGDSTSFTGLGYTYDPGKWFLRGEATRITGERDLMPKATRMYASAGMRLKAFTPYATVAKVNNDGPTSIGAADPIGVINGALAANNAASHSVTLGTRWDFHTNLDFKFEVTHAKNASGSAGQLTNLQPGFEPGKGYNLVSAVVDFVF